MSDSISQRPILIVEESPDDYFLLSHRIKASGIANPLICHFDGDEAIRYLTRAADWPALTPIPVALFVDIQVLGTDGLSVAAFARSVSAFHGLKIFVVTHSTNPAHKARAEELMVDAFLAKFPSIIDLQRLLPALIPRTEVV